MAAVEAGVIPHSARRLALSAALFFTGAAALVSEVAFTRSLALVVGSTARSAAVTLASYLLALAAGAAAGGRIADRSSRPALLLAVAWGLGALGTALVPEAIRAFAAVYVPASPATAFDSAAAFALSFVVVALPTTFLGASLPLVCRASGFGASSAGSELGWLAGWNTFGAVAGALAAPLLVSEIGIAATLRGAALVLASVALGVAFLRNRFGPVSRAGAPLEEAPRLDPGARGRSIPFAVAAAGAATLGLEILFMRILAIDLGGFSATYAGVIAVFLLGLAAGSIAAPRLRVARERPRAALAAALAAVAAAAPVSASLLFLVDGAADTVTRSLAPALGSGAAYLAACAAAACLMALVPAIGLGAVLPLAMGSLARGGERENGSVARLSGRLSFLQSAGGAAGALAAGYAGIELLGTKAAVLAAAALLLAASAAVARGAGMRLRSAGAAATIACVAAGVVALGPWRPLIADSHVFRGRRAADSVLVAASEEASGLASVVDDRRSGTRHLYTDGFLAAGTGPEYRYMRLLGHVPALLADAEPLRTGVVCYGSGTTAGALARHSRVASIEIAEISREVLALSPLFEAVNRGVLGDPRARAIVDDGRRWLRAGGPPFDVVTLEPLLPYTPAASSLYSLEFCRIARERLRDGGVFCQWIPLHCVEPRDLMSLVRAIAIAFPECALFVFEQSAIVVGVRGEFRLDLAAAVRRCDEASVAADLREAGCESALDALAGLVLDPEGVAALARSAAPLTDDRPSLELRALPRWALASYLADNLFTLLELASPAVARADASGFPAPERESRLADFDRHVRARRSLLRARAFADRSRFRALTGDRAAALEALEAARLTLDEALALFPGHAALESARRALD